jgi:hypothetical protein
MPPQGPPPSPQGHPTPISTPISESQQINISRSAPYSRWKLYWMEVEQEAREVRAPLVSAANTLAGSWTAYYTWAKVAPTLAKEAAARGGIVIRAGQNPLIIQVGEAVVALGMLINTEMLLIGFAAHEIALLDPPDPAFDEVYTPHRYELPPPSHSDALPPSFAAAADATVRGLLTIVSLSAAVLTALERTAAATAAGDDVAADNQRAAYATYTNEVAQAFLEGARLLEILVIARRTSGVPDAVLTADQVRAAQEQLAAAGFTDDALALFAWLGVSREFLEETILPGAISADPGSTGGSYDDLLLRQAELYRRVGTGLTGSSSRAFWVGNPHDQEETIDLFVRPVSMPPGWKVTIVSADSADQGASEFPVWEIEPGKHYAVTLPAHRQMMLTTMVAPAGEVGAGTTTRWAIEGNIREELLGGVLQEMTAA